MGKYLMTSFYEGIVGVYYGNQECITEIKSVLRKSGVHYRIVEMHNTRKNYPVLMALIAWPYDNTI